MTDSYISLPVLCGSAYLLNFAGMLVLSTSGATIKSMSKLIPSERKAQYLPLVLARFTAMSSLLDFFTTPIIGRLSDLYGRKPLLIVTMIISSVCRYFRGKSKSLISYFIYGAVGMVSGSAFFTTINASLSDVYTDKKSLAYANAKLGLFRGFSFIITPVLLGNLVGKNITLAFNVSSTLTLSAGIIMAMFFRETQTVSKRKKQGLSESSLSSLFAIVATERRSVLS